MNELKAGLTATVSETVLHTNTAAAVGSGLLNVYATPAMIALMEKAAVETIAPFLEKNYGSVGTKMNISHDNATLPGNVVTATAELTEIDGRRLVFKVSAQDKYSIIGQGLHERFIINNEKFMEKLKNKVVKK